MPPCDGRFAQMQGDGSLVLDKGSTSLWASHTQGSNHRSVMQRDGNLIVYKGKEAAVWSSRTDGYPDAFLIQVSRMMATRSSITTARQDGTPVLWPIDLPEHDLTRRQQKDKRSYRPRMADAMNQAGTCLTRREVWQCLFRCQR